MRWVDQMPSILECPLISPYYFIFFTIESFLKLLKKKDLNNNFSKYLSFSSLIILITFYFHTFNFNNFKENIFLTSFNEKDDFKLLDQDSKKFINESARYFKNEKCIFNFTTDISLPYFLKKSTCNKYFSPWLISGIKLENEYIKT